MNSQAETIAVDSREKIFASVPLFTDEMSDSNESGDCSCVDCDGNPCDGK